MKGKLSLEKISNTKFHLRQGLSLSNSYKLLQELHKLTLK